MRLVALLVSALALSCGASTPAPRPASPPRPVVVSPDRPTAVSTEPIVAFRLPMFAWAMKLVRAEYIEPERLVARKLLAAALDAMQGSLAELVVELRADDVVVRVNDKHRVFVTADIDDDSALLDRLEHVFGFIEAHKNPESDLRKLEYTAMNGVLDALDPHSSLLDPEDSREMAVRLSGKFGGLGIVIGVDRDKSKPRALVVRELIEGDTPAARARLVAGDRIVRINGEPTQNLTVEDAQSRLRGDPGTTLTLDIERGTAIASKELTRAQIRIPAVSGKLVGKRVGYLKLDQFSDDISVEVGRKLDELRRQGARAWVMDLRGNGGGYLGEAVRVVDRFVDRGVVVTSVGPARKRDYSAGASELDDRAPLVVLVDEDTASSAEIVSGALKYLDRALVLGTTTFGKGSVQTLYDNPSGAKLKVTIAQYLTAKGISIQSVGIVPDIAFARLAVPAKRTSPDDVLRLVSTRGHSEADLAAHLTSSAVVAEKPVHTISYLGPRADYVMDFAVQLASAAKGRTRAALLAEAAKPVAQRREAETRALAAALGKLGIDWTAGEHRPTQLEATFTADRARITAGDTVTITGTVKNTGSVPAYQVLATASSDDSAFDALELAFGRIDPGATKTVTAQVKTSKASDSRTSQLAWAFDEAHAKMTTAQPLAIQLDGLPRPRFAFAWHVTDPNDGLAQPGEKMRLYLRVKNTGAGRAPATEVTLKSGVADRILVDKGHLELGALEPGQTRDLELAFSIRNYLDLEKLKLELAIEDTELLEDAAEEIELRVKSAVGLAPSTGAVALTAATPLRMGADDTAAVLAPGRAGAVLAVTGRSPGWLRVELAPGRPAFVRADRTAPTTKPPSPVAAVWQATPPTLTLTEPPRETTTDSVRVTGFAQDDTKLEDIYIIVYNRTAKQRRRKVFYLSNRGGTPDARVEIATTVPLSQGSNAITVIARESAKVRSVHTFWVNRR